MKNYLKIAALILFVQFNLVSYAQEFDYAWVKSIGDGEGLEDNSNYAVQDALGFWYVAGGYRGTIDFNPDSTQTTLLGSNVRNTPYFAKYDSLGKLIWVRELKTGSQSKINKLALDRSGNLLLTGYYGRSIDLDASENEDIHYTTTSNANAFLVKYNPNGTYIWGRSLGGKSVDNSLALAVNSKNEIVIAGAFSDTAYFDTAATTTPIISSGGQDIFIATYDSLGNHIWSFGLEGSRFMDYANDLCLDDKDNIYIVGQISGTVDMDPSSNTANLNNSGGGTDVFFAKYSTSGVYIWAKSVGGSGIDQGYGIRVSPTDFVYISGHFQSINADFDPSSATATLSRVGREDFFIAKYTNLGNYVWAKSIGGSSNDKLEMLELDDQGNTYLTGYFVGAVDFDPSSATTLLNGPSGAIFLASYDSTGTLNWAKSVIGDGFSTGQGFSLNHKKNALMATGYIQGGAAFDSTISSSFFSTPNDRNASSYFVNYNLNGGFLNGFTTHDRLGDDDEIVALAHDKDGYLYVAGNYAGTLDFETKSGSINVTSVGKPNIFLAKFDSLGKMIWSKNIISPSSVFANDLALDNRGNVLLCGRFTDSLEFLGNMNSTVLKSNGSFDAFLAKFDSSGTLSWAYSFGSGTQDGANGIAADDDGNVLVTGSFRGTVDFNPGTGTASRTSRNTDIFLSKFSSSGNFIWVNQFNGNSNEVGNDMAIDDLHNIYLTGNFAGTVAFDPNSSAGNLRTNGSNDIFLAKYDSAGNYKWAFGIGGTSFDDGRDVLLGDDNQLYLSGIFQRTINFDPNAQASPVSSLGGYDMFIAKYDTSGVYQWANALGSTSNSGDFATGLAYHNEKVYLSGYFNDTIDFNPSLNRDSIIAPLSGNDGFLALYDTSGTFDDLVHSTGFGNILPLCLSVYNNASYIAGKYSFSFNAYNDNSPTKQPLSSIGGYDAFLLKLGNAIICKSTDSTIYETLCGPYLSPSKKHLYERSGVYIDTMVNAAGCDSLITIHLTLRNSFSVLNVAACDSFISPINKIALYKSRTYFDTLQNVVGCDSIITINLKIQKTYSKIAQTACDSFLSPSTKYWYYKTGTYFDTIPNFNNCDSIISIDLTILNKSDTTLNLSSCDSVVSPSTKYVYANSGSYTDTITNSLGCDSVIYINFTRLQATQVTVSVQSCDSFVSFSGKYIYRQSGQYQDTIINRSVCDSFITINLSIENTFNSISIKSCGSYTFPSGKRTVKLSGLYLDTLKGVYGCDSVLEIQVYILSEDSVFQQIKSCDSYFAAWSNYFINLDGIYIDTLINKNGCDSILVTEFERLKKDSSFISKRACNTYTLPSGSASYTQSGIYFDTLTNYFGCDSILTINLTVFPLSSTKENVTACDSFMLPGTKTLVLSSGIYIDSLQNINGCDSLVEMNIEIFNSSVISVQLTACKPFWSPSGKFLINSKGNYIDTLTGSNGCDSVLNLEVDYSWVEAEITRVDDSLFTSSNSDSLWWIQCDDKLKIVAKNILGFKPTISGKYALLEFLGSCSDTSVCEQVTVVGNGSLQEMQLSIFPNPVDDKLYIKWTNEREIEVVLYDIQGQQLTYIKAQNNSSEIDFSEFPSAVYLLKINTENKIYNYKIVK